MLRRGGTLAMSVPGPSDDGGWWAAYGAIVSEFTQRLAGGPPPGHRPTPLAWESEGVDVGLVLVEKRNTEVCLPLDGPERHWEWLMSHGTRWLYDALDPDSRAEFRTRVLRSLRNDHPYKGSRLIAGADLYRFVRPVMS